MKLWRFLKEQILMNPEQKIGENNAELTYEEAVIWAETFSEKLKNFQCCAVLCSSEMAAAISLLSCFAAGITAVPLSMRYGRVHCNKILGSVSPDGIIMDDGGEINVYKITDGNYSVPSEHPALIMCTSGTTGTPKGAMLSEHNIITNVSDISEYFAIGKDDNILICRPLYHCAVLTGEFLTALVKGAKIRFFSEKFNPAKIFELINRYEITAFCGTPTLLSIMARLKVKSEKNLLKHICISGECMSKNVGKRISDAFERVKTDEGLNEIFINEVEEAAETTEQHIKKDKSIAIEASVMTLVSDESEAMSNDEVAVANIESGISTDNCSTNIDMESAQEIEEEKYISGCICCHCAEQWFKFIPKENKTYTIRTTGSLDTIGYLYDCGGGLIASNDDYAGKTNFRIVRNLTAGQTYYVRVRAYGELTGKYTLNITEKIFVSSVKINKNQITLVEGVLYELPITPNYTYKGYKGAKRIPELSVYLTPSNANEQKIWWWEQSRNVLSCSYGYDDDGDGDRYIHVLAIGSGTDKLYAKDWNETGKRDECEVTVLTPYEKQLQEIGGFSSEVTRLILKLYDRVEEEFGSKDAKEKAWICARLLSEFSYDYITDFVIATINRWDDAAGSVTDEDNRKTYFINTLGYTESEYDTLNRGLIENHSDADKYHNVIDFTHMQFALASRLAYTLGKDGDASNWGTQLYTGNWGTYSDEEISYLGGWFGDAILAGFYAMENTSLKNDDYMADLDAENIYRLILQGNSSIDAINSYYSNMNASNTRADMFLQHISYSTVKQKIFYELIDADLYVLMTNASNQGDLYMTRHWLNLINDEQYHFDKIKSRHPDTYDFLMSLNDRLLTMAHYE